jgi:hypothetical protein
MEIDDRLKDQLDQGVDLLVKVQKDPSQETIQNCICALETIATLLRGLNVNS